MGSFLQTREEWAELAVKGILSGRERRAARQELLDHIDDHTEALMAAGRSADQASREAVAAMGDPEQTAALLRAAHQPVLTWLLRICRTAAILLLIAVMFNRAIMGLPYVDGWSTGVHDAQYLDYFSTPTQSDVDEQRFQGYRLLDEQTVDKPLGDYRLTGTRVSVNWDADHYATIILLEVTSKHPFRPAPVFSHPLTLTARYGQEEEVELHRLNPIMRGLNKRYYYTRAEFWQPPKSLTLEYGHPEGGFTHTIDLTGGTVYEKVG